MRLVTKAILVLCLVFVCVFAFFLAPRSDGTGVVPDPPKPSAKPPAPPARDLDDPLAEHERKWRERLDKIFGPGGAAPDRGPAPPADPHDLESSARDEGVIAVMRREEPVLGADPPGPVLRPDGVRGEVVTGPMRRKKEDPGRVHTVVRGDTLYDIARRYYGDAKYVQFIQAANPNLNADLLKVGERIVLPKPNDPSADEPEPKPAPQVYVVGRGDTLIGIARRLYGDAAMYLKIYESNRDLLSSPGATLYTGQRLRLPEPGGD